MAYKKCSIKEGRIEPCIALGEVLQSPGRGTRQQGLEMQSYLNMDSFKFSRNLVILKSGKHGKNGLVLDYCPWCRSKLRTK